MGEFFSDAKNGPAILLIILIVDVLVVLGGFFLVSRLFAARVIKRYNAILRLAEQGDTERARALADEWGRGDRPRSPLGRVSLAKIWVVLEEHERAIRILDTTRIAKSRACRPLRRIAAHVRYDALRGLGDHERAEWFRRDQAAIDPSAPWLAYARWEAAREEGDDDAEGLALDDLRARFAKDPKDELSLAVLAQEAFLAHRYEEAADLAERLMARLDRPGARRLVSDDLYLILGMAQVAAGRDGPADHSFRRFVERAPDAVAAERRVLSARAAAYVATRRLDDASMAYERLLAEEETADALIGLVSCVLRKGDVRRAEDLLDRAQEIGLPSEQARFLRAQILVDMGRVNEADRIATDAAAERPDSDPEALYTLAYVRATGQLQGAEETLRRYVAIQPGDPDLPPLLERPAPEGGTWREQLGRATQANG